MRLSRRINWFGCDETISCYADRVTIMEKRLATVGQAVREEDKIQTLLRGLPARFPKITDLSRELQKKRHEAVSMLKAKEEPETTIPGKSGPV